MAFTLLVALFLGTAFDQTVLVGQQPTKSEMEKLCNNEKLKPNLELQQSTHITGRVTDIVGNPLKKSRVELRTYISEGKQVTVKVTMTDENGYFDLGTAQKGKYRLLPAPSRAWKQPSRLECTDEKCDLNIALQVNPTDLPDAGCPIR
jgi:hypothetical protein